MAGLFQWEEESEERREEQEEERKEQMRRGGNIKREKRLADRLAEKNK